PAALSELRRTLPRLESTGITLALETYEQVPTPVLLEVITALDSPFVGVCLDPANCVSALEHPKQVVESCASHTVNLHVKDFAFAPRRAGSAPPPPAPRSARACPTSTTSSARSTAPERPAPAGAPPRPAPPPGTTASAPAPSWSTGCPGRETSRPPSRPN